MPYILLQNILEGSVGLYEVYTIQYMAIGTSIGPIHGQLYQNGDFFSIFGRFQAVAAGRFPGCSGNFILNKITYIAIVYKYVSRSCRSALHWPTGRVQSRDLRVFTVFLTYGGNQLPVLPKRRGVPYFLLQNILEGSVGLYEVYTVYGHRH